MRSRLHLGALLAISTIALGCNDKLGDTGAPAGDDTQITPGDDTGQTGDDTAQTGDDTGGISQGDWWDFPDVYGVPNVDDDNKNRSTDWNDGELGADENDLSTFIVPGELMAAVAEHGGALQLAIVGSHDVRVWSGGEILLSASNDSATLTGQDELELELEFGDYLAQVEVALSWTLEGEIVGSGSFTATAAPLIFNHHVQPAEQTWALSVGGFYSNAAMIQGYQAELGSNFTALTGYGGDVWIQDELEFGTLTGDEGQRIDVIFDTIRNRGMDAFPETLSGQVDDHVPITWGGGGATSQDYGGNIEISPPATVGGVEYPFGRIYYGARNNWAPHAEVQAMFEDMKVQDPFEIDTLWLCVGHIDEYTTFLPDTSSAKGYKFVFADTRSAWTFLEGLDPNMQLPQYRDHGYDSVGEILADSHLRDANDQIQETYLDAQLEQFKDELGLTDDDVILMPSLFETYGWCGNTSAALIPGTANLIVAEDEAGVNHAFMPDPFFRSDTSDQSTDPFIALVDSLIEPLGLETVYLDDWDAYHMQLGEVHCGSNVRRTPVDDWWTTATHLLE